MSQTTAEMSWNSSSSGTTATRHGLSRPGNSVPVPVPLPVSLPVAGGGTASTSSTATLPTDGTASSGSHVSPSRIPSWGRSSSSSSNYVTIGTIRYGVRFASTSNLSPPREEPPPRGDASNHHAHGADCCCGVVQLLSPSRIPLPADKTPAINRRGIFSRINSGELSREPAVYRSTLEWSHQQQQQCLQPRTGVASSCFGVTKVPEDDNRRDGLSMQQRSPQREHPRPSTSSPTRRRILVRPKPDIPAYLKLCGSASSDSETSNLLTPSGSSAGSRDNLAEEDYTASSNPRRNTLDRLHKFRFGGSGGDRGKKGTSGEGSSRSSGSKKKPPRSSDKTESLRELTERLKGSTINIDWKKRTPGTESPCLPAKECAEEAASPTVYASSSGVSVSGKDSVNKEVANKNLGAVTRDVGGNHATTKSMSSVDSPGVRNSATDEDERTEPIKEDDILECVNLRLAKAESRTIVGSYIQRTIPIRSVSFSQVDFSPSDGKYIRSSARSSPFSGFTTTAASGALPLSPSSVIAGGSLTLPRKRIPDITATTVSPSSSTTLCADEPSGSTPSVDSAVGSDEGFVTSVIPKIPIVNKGNGVETGGNSDMSHKPPGSRSLTYPLPRRGSRSDEDIPFSSIDGNGLKSLLYVPVPTGAGRELQEVAEESEQSLIDSVVTSKSSDISLNIGMNNITHDQLSFTDSPSTQDVSIEEPSGDNFTLLQHKSAQCITEGNVMDPSLSTALEHCVGDENSAACQHLEHPAQFASPTIQVESEQEEDINTDPVRDESELKSDVISASNINVLACQEPNLIDKPDSNVDSKLLDKVTGDGRVENSESHCSKVISELSLIKEQVDNCVRLSSPNQINNEPVSNICCNVIEDAKCESKISDSTDSDVFVTEWPKENNAVFEKGTDYSSHMNTEENRSAGQTPKSDACRAWVEQTQESEASRQEASIPKQVPESENEVQDGKDRDIEHSIRYAQETELLSPWQDTVVNKPVEGNSIQMETNDNKRINNGSWNAQEVECQPRWSGDGTEGGRTPAEWGNVQEESQSPDETNNNKQKWPKSTEKDGQRWQERPRLVCQSSEEREDETSSRPSPRRYQLLARADSLSEGESDHGDRCPVTPLRDRERDRTASPSFFAPSDLSDSEGRTGGGGSGAGCDNRSPHTPRRYSKRPLRGPYGQMLEAEMKKPETNRIFSKLQYNEDLKFLEEYASPTSQRPSSPSIVNSSRSSPATAEILTPVARPTSPDPRANNARPRALTTQSLDDSQLKGGYGRSSSTSTPVSHTRTSPKRKVSANIPYSAPNPITSAQDSGRGIFVCHQRTTSSPSQLEGYAVSRHEGSPRPEATPELLAELLRGSSERLFAPTNVTPNGNSVHHWKDTRTHVVVELFETERSYVESLQILVMKYLKPLKSPENSGLVDAALVDEIFYQVPAILSHHEVFLEELRKRLDNWDIKQTVGDVFLDAFTKQSVIETYTSFINNWKTAKEAIKSTCQAKPAFARFLEAMAREHKGKLALDSLLIMPVQRIPRYELLIQTLLKHTDTSHPDHQVLLEAQRQVHDLAVKINCTERETLEYEQQQQTLKELEALIEGLINLVAAERTFIRHDLVTMASGQGTRKERALFLFSDLLVITSIKRRSGTIRKPSTSCPGSVASTLEGNKYKLLMRIPLDDLEIVKAKDENLRRMLREMENLAEDVAILNQINDLTATLHCPHAQLEDLVREMLGTLNKQLAERQNSDSQLSYLELTLNTQSGIENISVVFTKPEKKTSWEESFNEAKQKLALSADRRPSPEFLSPLPIRKTRAGLQFTCAAPTLGLNAYNMRDVWVCNSDGYVGQVCVLSLQPEPTVISCNGVCNARILCVASIPIGVTGPVSSNTSGPGPFTNSKAGISISVEDADEGNGNIQLDSSSSSEDDDETDDANTGSGQGDDEQRRIRSASDSLMSETGLLSDEMDTLQPTMWLGTEDGCIHVYNCSDNIRIKKNKVKIQHGSSVHCIIYLDNRVFVSLANGDITVYVRDQNGGWNTTDPYTVSVGTAAMPVTRMLPISGKLWCGCHNSIKILNTSTLEVEHSFLVNPDSSRAVTCMAVSGFGVWISLQNSAVIRLFHTTTYECLCDVNVAPAVTKMLASCDDIIRQHKAACLRVTSLLACKDLLWIGTSAGVILTMPLPHISASTTKLTTTPNATGVPHGHTGHVRFLTFVETSPATNSDTLMVRPSNHHRYSLKSKPDLLSHQNSSNSNMKLLVISGGDGYEDFRTSSVSEVAGREDSTNHLLLWHV